MKLDERLVAQEKKNTAKYQKLLNLLKAEAGRRRAFQKELAEAKSIMRAVVEQLGTIPIPIQDIYLQCCQESWSYKDESGRPNHAADCAYDKMVKFVEETNE